MTTINVGSTIQQDPYIQTNLQNTLNTISVNIEALIENQDAFAHKIELQFTKNQAHFSSEILLREIFKLNNILKQKLKLSTSHFLYKDIYDFEILGKGAFGSVLKVYDPETKQFFAKKVLDCNTLTQFATLALGEILPIYYISQIKTLSLLSIYRINYNHNTRLEIIMEYGIGTLEDLIRYMAEKGAIYENFYYECAAELKEQLEILHSNKLCHRDIKPQNVIISKSYKYKFSDYGCCTKFKYRGRQEINVVGTPKYMNQGLLEAMKTKMSAKTCPYEADEYALDVSLKEVVERTKDCKEKITKFQLLNDFDTFMNMKTFDEIKEIDTKISIVKSLEEIWWSNPENGIECGSPEALRIRYLLLVNERLGRTAHEEGNYNLAMTAFEKILGLIKENQISDYRGEGLLVAATMQVIIGDYKAAQRFLETFEVFQEKYGSRESSKYNYIKRVMSLNIEKVRVEKIEFKANFFEEGIDEQIEDMSSFEPFDKNQIIFKLLSVNAEFRKKCVNYYESNKFDEWKRILESILEYYSCYIKHFKSLRSEKETGMEIFKFTSILEKCQKNYQFITERVFLEFYQQAYKNLRPYQSEFRKELAYCSYQIGKIMSGINGYLDSNSTALKFLEETLTQLDVLSLDEDRTIEFYLSLARSAEYEAKHNYYQKVLELSLKQKKIDNQRLTRVSREIIHYYKFMKNKEKLEDFYKKYFVFFNKNNAVALDVKYQIAVDYNFKYCFRDEIKKILDAKDSKIEFPLNHVNQLLDAWNQIKIIVKGDNKFLTSLFEEAKEIKPKKEPKPTEKKDKINKSQNKLECLESRNLFKSCLNILFLIENNASKNARPLIEKLIESSYKIFNAEDFLLTQNIKFSRLMYYFIRKIKNPSVDYRHLYEAIQFIDYEDYPRALFQLEKYYEKHIKSLTDIQNQDLIEYIEIAGECILNLYERNLDDSPLSIKVLQSLKNLSSLKNEGDEEYTKGYQALFSLYQLEFDQANAVFSELLEIISERVAQNFLEKIIFFRAGQLKILQGDHDDSYSFLSTFKSLANRNKQSFDDYYDWDLYLEKLVIYNGKKQIDYTYYESKKEEDEYPSEGDENRGEERPYEAPKYFYDPYQEISKEKPKLTLEMLRQEFKMMFTGHSESSALFTIYQSGNSRFDCFSKWADITTEYLTRFLQLSDFRFVELLYLKFFSQKFIFGNNIISSIHANSSDLQTFFNKTLQLHRKYCDHEQIKVLEDFGNWVFNQFEKNDSKKLKEVVDKFLSNIETWLTSPFVVSSFLSRFSTLKIISEIKKHQKTKESLIKYCSFIKIYEEEKRQGKNNQMYEEYDRMVMELDDYDESFIKHYQQLYLLEQDNDKALGQKHIQTAYKIMRSNYKSNPHSQQTILQLLIYYMNYSDPINHKEDMIFFLKRYCQAESKSKDKVISNEWLTSVKSEVKKEVVEGNEVEKFSFQITWEDPEKILDFLDSNPVFLSKNYGDDLYFGDNRKFEILLNKPRNKGIDTPKVNKFNPEKRSVVKDFLTIFKGFELITGFIHQSSKNFSQSIFEFIDYLNSMKNTGSYDSSEYIAVCLHITNLAMKIDFIQFAVVALSSAMKLFELNDIGKRSPNLVTKDINMMIKLRLAILLFKIDEGNRGYNLIRNDLENVQKAFTGRRILQEFYSELLPYQLANSIDVSKSFNLVAEKFDFADEKKAEDSINMISILVLQEKDEILKGLLEKALSNPPSEGNPKIQRYARFLTILLILINKKQNLDFNNQMQDFEIFQKNMNDISLETIVAVNYFEKLTDKQEDFPKTRKILSKYFRSSINDHQRVDNQKLPESMTNQLKSLKLEDIFKDLTYHTSTTTDLILSYRELQISWRKWEFYVNFINYGLINSFYRFSSENSEDNKTLFLQNLIDLVDVTQYENHARKHLQLLYPAYLGDYVDIERNKHEVNNKKYYCYIFGDAYHKIFSRNELKGREIEIPQRKVEMASFNSYRLQKDLAAHVELSSKLDSPYIQKFLDFFSQHELLVWERVDYSLAQLMENYSRFFINVDRKPESIVLRYVKEFMEAYIELAEKTPFPILKLKASAIRVREDHIKLSLSELIAFPEIEVYQEKASKKGVSKSKAPPKEANQEFEDFKEKNIKNAGNIFSELLLGKGYSQILVSEEIGGCSKQTLNLLNMMVNAEEEGKTMWSEIVNHPALGQSKFL